MIIDDEESEEPPLNTECYYPGGCKLDAPMRRVISQFFGRNKKETRAIPDECWYCYCRQHYQRSKYRLSKSQFAILQMDLVKKTVERLEYWGNVTHWEIALRKRALDSIAKEDYSSSTSSQCRERKLLPLIGKEKTFADVYAVINAVQEHSKANGCPALDFEIVPHFRPGVMSRSVKRIPPSLNMNGTKKSVKVRGK
jgi:hypothetical protein